MSAGANAEANRSGVRVQYEESTARYANHVILQASEEEIYINFSSGILQAPQGGEPIMPVHTRIAMTHASARRFSELLAQAVDRTPGAEGESDASVTDDGASGFPTLS